MASKSGTRLFLDSNVLTAGIVSEWGLDKAVLSICAARVCRMVLADVVRYEVEENLLHHASLLPIPASEHSSRTTTASSDWPTLKVSPYPISGWYAATVTSSGTKRPFQFYSRRWRASRTGC